MGCTGNEAFLDVPSFDQISCPELRDARKVSLTAPPAIGKYEVTFLEYDYFLWRVRPQFEAAARGGTPKRFIFCQNCVHL